MNTDENENEKRSHAVRANQSPPRLWGTACGSPPSGKPVGGWNSLARTTAGRWPAGGKAARASLEKPFEKAPIPACRSAWPLAGRRQDGARFPRADTDSGPEAGSRAAPIPACRAEAGRTAGQTAGQTAQTLPKLFGSSLRLGCFFANALGTDHPESVFYSHFQPRSKK